MNEDSPGKVKEAALKMLEAVVGLTAEEVDAAIAELRHHLDWIKRG